jgi:hypothetical protein
MPALQGGGARSRMRALRVGSPNSFNPLSTKAGTSHLKNRQNKSAGSFLGRDGAVFGRCGSGIAFD